MKDEVYEEFVKRLTNKQLAEVCTEDWNRIEDKNQSSLYRLCDLLEQELETTLSDDEVIWADQMYNAIISEVVDRFIEMVK
jgi:FMN-dependent NADH-azoreductase